MKNSGSSSIMVLALAAAACTPHVQLEPIAPVASERISVAAHVEVPPATATAIGEVHSFQGGNCVIEVGHAIVQYADAYLANAFMPGNDLTVRVELDAFSVHDFEAHADMRFTVLRGSSQLFQKTYQCMGAGYAARVIWAGGFAMKSSMRKTTDEALRQCFGRFLIDAKAESPTWASASS
jgi:hypothetical protein